MHWGPISRNYKEVSFSGEAAGKVAVVQLCVESSRCDVMHIMHSGIPSSLASLLRDSSILKVWGEAYFCEQLNCICCKNERTIRQLVVDVFLCSCFAIVPSFIICSLRSKFGLRNSLSSGHYWYIIYHFH